MVIAIAFAVSMGVLVQQIRRAWGWHRARRTAAHASRPLPEAEVGPDGEPVEPDRHGAHPLEHS